jgi:hypothetical protein
MEFYNSQLSSENYQVREAACHALSELFLRVAPSFNSDAFKPYVKQCASALALKLRDPAWGTRVHSLLALSYLLKTYHSDFSEEDLKAFTD